MAILSAVLGVCLLISLTVRFWNASNLRSSALEQAKESQERGDIELAIRHIDRFLADRPDDLPALQKRSELVLISPRTGEQLLDAANTLDRLIKLDPDGEQGSPEEKSAKNRDETKLKLAELYVVYSDYVKEQFRRYGETGTDEDAERKLYRYGAAVELTRQLLNLQDEGTEEPRGQDATRKDRKQKPTDGDAHRFLAMALEGQDSEVRDRGANDSRVLQEAISHYRRAIEIRPGDMVAAVRLANLYQARLKDPAGAEKVINDLIKAEPRSVQVRLVCHDFFARSKREDRARTELEAALALARDDIKPGFDLEFLPSLKDASKIPAEGKGRIIVALVGPDAGPRLLHVRIFNDQSKKVVDTDERRLPDQSQPIEELKKRLKGLPAPTPRAGGGQEVEVVQVTGAEKAPLVESIGSVVGHTVPISVQAAKFALSHRDTAEARRQLAAIPAPWRENDLNVRVLTGFLEYTEQHPDQAIDQWRRGLSLVAGGDLDLTWQLAYYLINLGRLSEADPLVKQYIRLAKGDKNRKGKLLEGLYELKSGHVNEATKIFEKIKDVVQSDLKADTLLALGKCYEQRGEITNALIAYRNAVTAAPSFARPRLEVARMIQKHHPEDAIGELDRALSESPDDPTLLLQVLQLRILRQQSLPADLRQWGEVKDLLDRAEKVVPNNWSLRNLKAEYMAASGSMDAAVGMIEAAAKGVDRKRIEAWISWSLGLERLKRRDEAIKALEQGALPENAGDHAKLRVAKAQLLIRSGRGQAALEALTTRLEAVPEGEMPELVQAKADLLRQLGDREGSKKAYLEWARLDPRSPRPGLALLDLAQLDNDEQAAKLGLETLRSIGGDNQPYGMAARAFNLLRLEPGQARPSSDRIDQADWLIKSLRSEAPSLSLGYLLEGMILEYRDNLPDAIKSYRLACKEDPISFALPRLIEAYIKLKRYDELEQLKGDVEREALARQLPLVVAEFDRVAALASLRVGDKDRADFYAAKMVEGRPDSVQSHAAYANLLYQNGKPDEALKTLQQYADRNKNDAVAWLTLIAFEAIRKTPADVTRTIQKARQEYRGERPELFLAQCYWIGKNIPEARTAYQKAVELRPNDLVTLRSQVEFFIDAKQLEGLDALLRKVLKVDPTTSWAARLLADQISAKSDPATWQEAWALVAPGSSAAGDTPEDRLMRATVLARSPESARRAEAIPAFIALANDLPVASPLAIDTRVRLSQAMMDIGRFADAWEYVKPIADEPNPNRINATALLIAIEALSRAGKPDEAERRLDRMVVFQPKSPQNALSKAWVLMARGRAAEASASAGSAYEQAKDDPNAEVVAMAAVELLYKFKDLAAAETLAEEIARRWPKDAGVLARIQVARKEYDKVLATSQVAFGAGSYVEPLRAVVGAAVGRRSDAAFLKRAVQLGDQAREKAPRNFGVLVLLATLRHLEDRYEEELALYREARELNPNHVEFLNNMAWTLCEGLNKPEEALKQVDEAIRREGRAPQYLDTRGVILSRLGKFNEAITDLEQSAKNDPSPTTYFHLARTYLLANKPAESQRCRDLALKAKFDPEILDPTDRSDLAKVMGNP